MSKTSLLPSLTRFGRRPYATFVFLVVICSSCAVYEPYIADQHEYETYLPIRPSGDPRVELFFEDDPFPNKPYVEGGRVGVIARSHRHSSMLAEQLRAKARKLGYDGVVNISKHHEWKEEYTFWDFVFAEGGEVYPSGREYAILSGRGIKFVENIDYLHRQKKSQVAIQEEDGVLDTLFTKTFYPDGAFKSVAYYSDQGERLHDDVISKYDLQRLLYEENGWEYRTDELGRVTSRRHRRFDDWILEKVKCQYERGNGRLNEVQVTVPVGSNGMTSTYTIQVYHDEMGRIIRKQIERYGEARWQEQLSYNDNGRLVRSEFRRPNWTDKKITVTYEYFQQEDLPELLKEDAFERQAVTISQ